MGPDYIVRIGQAKDVAVIEVIANDLLNEVSNAGYRPGIVLTIHTPLDGETIYVVLVTGIRLPPSREG